MRPRTARATRFPYTPLFRSGLADGACGGDAGGEIGEGDRDAVTEGGTVLQPHPRFRDHAQDSLRTDEQPVRARTGARSEEHTSELQSLRHLVCRLLLENNTN